MMTVRDLKAILDQYTDDSPVFVRDENGGHANLEVRLYPAESLFTNGWLYPKRMPARVVIQPLGVI